MHKGEREVRGGQMSLECTGNEFPEDRTERKRERSCNSHKCNP